LRTKTALRVKKEEEASSTAAAANPTVNTHLEASENLRTIEVEVQVAFLMYHLIFDSP
jgi:hypothetical protein